MQKTGHFNIIKLYWIPSAGNKLDWTNRLNANHMNLDKKRQAVNGYVTPLKAFVSQERREIFLRPRDADLINVCCKRQELPSRGRFCFCKAQVERINRTSLSFAPPYTPKERRSESLYPAPDPAEPPHNNRSEGDATQINYILGYF